MKSLKINGNKFFPTFYRIILFLLEIFSLYIAYLVTPIALVLSFFLLFVILFIRNINLEIKEDKFIIERNSILQRFSKKDEYNYSNIKSVEYIEGFFSIKNLIYSFIGGHNTDTVITSPDCMKIIKKNNDEIDIKRIGSRKEFLNAISLIKEKIV